MKKILILSLIFVMNNAIAVALTPVTQASKINSMITKINTVTTYVDSGWIPITTYATGFHNYARGYNDGAYRRMSDGTVKLRGLIEKSGAMLVGSCVFQLPIEFRPKAQYLLQTNMYDTEQRVDIAVNGCFYVNTTLANNSNIWVSLDNLSFMLD